MIAKRKSQKIPEAKFLDPYKHFEMKFTLVPIEKLKVIPHQRKPSQYHIKHLVQSMERVGITVPLIVVAENDNYTIIDGQHRFLAAKELGAQYLPVIIVPNHFVNLMMNFNIEKELNIREKSHVALSVYREFLKDSPEKLETDAEIVDSIENAYYVTCGLAYEASEKFSGSIFESLLKKADFFLEMPITEALKEREKRAEKLITVYDEIREIAQQLKTLGEWHPYIYQQIMAYVNPYKRKRLPVDFNEIFNEILENLQTVKRDPKVVFKTKIEEL